MNDEGIVNILRLREKAAQCRQYAQEARSRGIAADLGISQRTVETHRASIMRKTGAKSLPALARLALAATGDDEDEALV